MAVLAAGATAERPARRDGGGEGDRHRPRARPLRLDGGRHGCADGLASRVRARAAARVTGRRASTWRRTCSSTSCAGRKTDRIGVVVFAKQAFVLSPATLDYGLITGLVSKIELGVIDGSKTAIGDAVGTAVARMRRSDARSRAVVLLTDGDSNEGVISPEYSAHLAQKEGVRVYTVQIGNGDDVDVADGDGSLRPAGLRATTLPGEPRAAAQDGARHGGRVVHRDGQVGAREEHARHPRPPGEDEVRGAVVARWKISSRCSSCPRRCSSPSRRSCASCSCGGSREVGARLRRRWLGILVAALCALAFVGYARGHRVGRRASGAGDEAFGEPELLSRLVTYDATGRRAVKSVLLVAAMLARVRGARPPQVRQRDQDRPGDQPRCRHRARLLEEHVRARHRAEPHRAREGRGRRASSRTCPARASARWPSRASR